MTPAHIHNNLSFLKINHLITSSLVTSQLYSSHSVPKHLITEDGNCTTTETFGFVIPSLASEFNKR